MDAWLREKEEMEETARACQEAIDMLDVMIEELDREIESLRLKAGDRVRVYLGNCESQHAKAIIEEQGNPTGKILYRFESNHRLMACVEWPEGVTFGPWWQVKNLEKA